MHGWEAGRGRYGHMTIVMWTCDVEQLTLSTCQVALRTCGYNTLASARMRTRAVQRVVQVIQARRMITHISKQRTVPLGHSV